MKTITKSELVEYKRLIIFMTNKYLFFKGQKNLVAVMTTLLERVEAGELKCKTQRGVKGLICNEVIDICQKLCVQIIENEEGSEIWTNSNMRTREGNTLERMNRFYKNLMFN